MDAPHLDDTLGVCKVTTVSTINMHSGPGAGYDISGQLSPGEDLTIEAMAEDDEGNLTTASE